MNLTIKNQLNLIQFNIIKDFLNLIFFIKNANAINNYITPTTINAIDKNKFFPPNGPDVDNTIFFAPANIVGL